MDVIPSIKLMIFKKKKEKEKYIFARNPLTH